MNRRTILTLTALVLATPAQLHAGGDLPEVPIFGKLRVSSYQPLEDFDAMTAKVWN